LLLYCSLFFCEAR